MMDQDQPKLIDAFGRRHESLRISVTDRCNIRCFYCMPLENVTFLPRSEVLTFEEIERVVDVVLDLGIRKIRVTGGEPLVRQGLSKLIARLASKSKLQDLALTTNGLLLERDAQSLADAGLQRLNISLDTLSEATFEKISRRSGLAAVLNGIAAARRAGFRELRINAVAMAGINESDLVPLARFCREQDLHLRLIEFMPLDAEQKWGDQPILTGRQVRELLSQSICSLEPIERWDPSQPAVDFRYSDGVQQVGFINSISEPFCSSCNRLRLTAEGKFRNCLFGTEEWDARAVLRQGGSTEDLIRLLEDCVWKKKSGHGIGEPGFVRPDKSMYQIGG